MTKRLVSTPKKDGFRMPGEFEKHEKTWMIWPEKADNWRYCAKPVQKVFIQVAKEISKFEPVVVCASSLQYQNALKSLGNNIQVIEMSSDDMWIRDTGPAFLVDDKGNLRAVDWEFNAWGGLEYGLYSSWDKDNQIAKKICELENIDLYKIDDFVLEGGSIHVDGEGTCIVTQACLLHKGRNPHLSKNEIDQNLKNFLNVEKIIWLENGIYLDETDEHVDNILHFIAPATVVLAWTDDKNDPQYEMSKKAFDLLSSQKDSKGREFKIHKLYLPNPPITVTEEEAMGCDLVKEEIPKKKGDRQAASYANFLIVNGGVILPIFNVKEDKIAVETLQKVLPNHKIVTINSREILLGGGNIHCITQQQPLKVTKK
ncbi:MAG: agmatine deiminase [Sulfurospirillum sp.]|nr:agmatine deiminase [Sulfurospirillum sp.]MBL0703370.1 agmatine deiminase [Sulfurospirillum sp.]